jgi:uncharacterized peroxidase-related enzyme
MSWIKVIDEDEATGRLAKLYAACADDGGVDNVLKIHSLNPAGLAAHLAVYKSAMHGTETLPKDEREMIAIVVSKANGCFY